MHRFFIKKMLTNNYRGWRDKIFSNLPWVRLEQIDRQKGDRNNNKGFNKGFTIVEVAIVVLIIGVLSAIAAPSWLAFTNRQRLRTSTDRVYSALKRARSNAKLNRETLQASFRQTDVDLNKNGTIEADEQQRVQWAVHPASMTDANISDLLVASASDEIGEYKWHVLEANVRIDTTKTTMEPHPTIPDFATGGVYEMQFNYQGNANGQLGKITLFHTGMNEPRRCVYVSTLIGAMRTDTEEDNGCG